MSDDVKATVRERYGQAASKVASGEKKLLLLDQLAAAARRIPITSNLYSACGDGGCCRKTAVLASLGCGNPTALPS